MLKGFDDNGNLKDVKVTEDGAIKVAVEEGGSGSQTTINNTSENPVPVNVVNNVEIETTLNSSIQTLGATSTSISINKKVTSIDIANYSETASITVTLGNKQLTIGNNVAVTLPVNANIENVVLSASEENTKAQVIVKGVN